VPGRIQQEKGTIMNLDDYIELVEGYKKVALTGPPKSGKTTLANEIKDRPIIHTDDYAHLAWKDQATAPLIKTATLDKFLIEGVQVPRALRKGLEIQIVICLGMSLEPLNTYQAGTAKSIRTILAEWSRSSMGEAIPIVYLNQAILIP